MNGRNDGRKNVSIDGLTYEWTNECVDGRTNGRTDGLTDARTGVHRELMEGWTGNRDDRRSPADGQIDRPAAIS